MSKLWGRLFISLPLSGPYFRSSDKLSGALYKPSNVDSADSVLQENLSQIKTQDEYGITDARFDAALRRRQTLSLNQPIPRQPFSLRGLWTHTEDALLPPEPQLALTQPPEQAVLPVVQVVEAKVKGKPK